MSERQWKNAMVILERGEAMGSGAAAPASERRQEIRANAAAKRAELLREITKAGIADEVQVPEAGPSSMLMIRATDKALEALQDADAVKSVRAVPDARMEQI